MTGANRARNGADDESPWTVPNAIAAGRIVGLGPLLWLAWAGHRQWFFWLLVVLMASDWLDGRLARWLGQETDVGARLDSVADGLMYSVIGIGLWWLEADAITANAPLIAGVFATWGLSALVALIRFGSLPSYHTRGAKISWFMAALAALALFMAGSAALLPWAFGLVILTNLEAAAIGVVLPEWKANVAWIGEAVRLRRAEGGRRG